MNHTSIIHFILRKRYKYILSMYYTIDNSSLYFINPVFPSPSASFLGFNLSINEGLPLVPVVEVEVELPDVVVLLAVPLVPVVPVPVVEVEVELPDVVVLVLLAVPLVPVVPVPSFSVNEVVPLAPAPPSVPPTAFGSPPKASVRSSRPPSEPP